MKETNFKQRIENKKIQLARSSNLKAPDATLEARKNIDNQEKKILKRSAQSLQVSAQNRND